MGNEHLHVGVSYGIKSESNGCASLLMLEHNTRFQVTVCVFHCNGVISLPKMSCWGSQLTSLTLLDTPSSSPSYFQRTRWDSLRKASMKAWRYSGGMKVPLVMDPRLK